MTHPTLLQVGALPEWDETPLSEEFNVIRHIEATGEVADLTDVGPSIRAIATRGTLGADAALIAACPNLQIIAVYGVGFDAVDLEACRARGIRVTNTPDVLTEDVADFGLAMMLAQRRGLSSGEAWVRSGDWASKGVHPLQRRVQGGRAGIVGLGRIGRAVSRRLEAFDISVSYTDVAPNEVSQRWAFHPDAVSLAQNVDTLFLTLSASDVTRGIINRDVLEALGPDGLLVNISRASVVNEPDLIKALTDGTLGAAALDVFEGEPNLDPRFLDLPNVLLQPHQASGTIETRKDMGRLMRANLSAHFNGEPLPTPVL